MAPSKTLDDYINKINDKVQFVDTGSPITEGQIVSALGDAVDQYSRDKPLRKIHTIDGDGTSRYSLPSDWTEGFSYIVYVEFPTESSNPSILDDEAVLVWDDGDGEKFQFKFAAVASNDTVRVKYTLAHTLDSDNNTIPDMDFEAVGFLGTAFTALNAAGTLLKPRSDGNRGTGSVITQFRTLADEYKSYSQEMLKQYYRRLGINPEQGTPGVLRLFDITIKSSTGLDWLTHGNR